MKILIISDSHRNKEIIREVIKTDKFDKVIHCGDSGLKLKELKEFMRYEEIVILTKNP